MDRDRGETRRLVRSAGEGDAEAARELQQVVYDELTGHTLQPTALVHEAWVRLVGSEGPGPEDRVHFVRVAARAMRNALVDHARAKQAQKRGGGAARAPIDPLLVAYEENDVDVLVLHEALERLAAVDEQLARLVELRFFAGLTTDQAAPVLGVSVPTVHRRWRMARIWLRRELSGEA